MRIIRGGDKSNFNSWAWTMIVFKPQFFNLKNPQDD